MYTREDVKRVQYRLLEMALAVRNILEGHGIPYFLAYGSLLGAVRHKGFIPWDDDFDLYLFDDSYDEAMSVLRRELPEGMFLEFWETEPKYFHAWAHVKDLNTKADCDMFPHDGFYSHQGVSVDLYRIKEMPFSEVSSYRLNENIAYLERRMEKGLINYDEYNDKIKSLEEKKNTLEKQDDNHLVYATVLPILEWIECDDIIPLKKYSFEGYDFYGPYNADSFLTKRYGEYMKLPSEKEQKPHYSSVLFT